MAHNIPNHLGHVLVPSFDAYRKARSDKDNVLDNVFSHQGLTYSRVVSVLTEEVSRRPTIERTGELAPIM